MPRRATGPDPGSVHAIGDGLELDVAAHELRRGREVIHLRPKEFGLLALLAAHPGRAYSRRELLDRVWGPGPPGRHADGRRPRPLAALEDRTLSRATRAPRSRCAASATGSMARER